MADVAKTELVLTLTAELFTCLNINVQLVFHYTEECQNALLHNPTSCNTDPAEHRWTRPG